MVLHALDSSHYGPLEYDISGPNGPVEVDYYSWDGKDFRRNGDTVSLPFQYFKDPLPLGHIRTYPVDLDILHPASGKLKERLEDKDHDSEGGYVALKRAVEGEDLAPVTRLVLRATELPDKDSFWRNTFHTTSSNFEDLFAEAPDWLNERRRRRQAPPQVRFRLPSGLEDATGSTRTPTARRDRVAVFNRRYRVSR